MRAIKSIHKSQKINMGGIILDQPLPVGDLQSIDPFLLIHHWEDKLPGDQRQREVGVGPHPHRGFSPVTMIYAGDIHHRDSFGNDSIVKAGGVQWMVAGKGVTHSERPSQELAADGGDFEIIQFWVNLPASEKMAQPAYFPLQANEIPTYEGEGVQASVVHGKFKGISGGIKSAHDVTVVSITLKAGASLAFDIPKSDNGILYQLDGSIAVQNGDITYAKTIYEMGAGDSEKVEIRAAEDTRLLLLHGKPLNEKVVQYGPFVMNDQTQIMEAIRDSQMGKMGVLIE